MNEILARRFVQAIDSKDVPGNKSYNGTVSIVSGQAYVTLDGASEATPCVLLMNAKHGERVSVSIDNHKAYVTGNATSPATDDTVANQAAAGVAAVNQHFWADSSGSHVSDFEQTATVKNGGESLLTGSGLTIRKWENNVSSDVASFGSDGAVIGKTGNSHQSIDPYSWSMIDKNGIAYAKVEDLRGSDGIADMTFSTIGDGTTSTFDTSLTIQEITLVTVDGAAPSSYQIDQNTKISITPTPSNGSVIYAEYTTMSSGAKAYSFCTRRSGDGIGARSFAEGRNTSASGFAAHAEGQSTRAYGYYSHAEGRETSAGDTGHAEGYLSVASGRASHAEGSSTEASGDSSHASGYGTVADGNYQTSVGYFNTRNSGHIFSVGNGSDNTHRSDAFYVDSDGSAHAGNKMVAVYDSFVVENYSHSLDSISAYGSGEETFTKTKSGYYPIGVVGTYCGGTAGVFRAAYLSSASSGSCSVRVGIRNVSSSAITPTVYIRVLWVRM